MKRRTADRCASCCLGAREIDLPAFAAKTSRSIDILKRHASICTRAACSGAPRDRALQVVRQARGLCRERRKKGERIRKSPSAVLISLAPVLGAPSLVITPGLAGRPVHHTRRLARPSPLPLTAPACRGVFPDFYCSVVSNANATRRRKLLVDWRVTMRRLSSRQIRNEYDHRLLMFSRFDHCD